jgi:hypothetical protein
MACADCAGRPPVNGAGRERMSPELSPCQLLADWLANPSHGKGSLTPYLRAAYGGSGWSGQRTWRRVCARLWTRSCPCWRSGKTATAGMEPAVWPASTTGEIQVFSRRLHNVIRAIPWTRRAEYVAVIWGWLTWLAAHIDHSVLVSINFVGWLNWTGPERLLDRSRALCRADSLSGSPRPIRSASGQVAC